MRREGAASAGRKDERFREYFCIRRKLLDERLISSQDFSSSVRMVLLFVGSRRWSSVYATDNFISRFKCIVSEYKHPGPPSKDTRARTDQRLTSSFRLECILRHNGFRPIPISQDVGLTMQKKTDASNASTMCHSSSSTSQRVNDAAKSIPSIMYWFL